MRAIDELRRLGYRIKLDGEEVVCRFVGIGQKPDREQVVLLLLELKAGKAEAVVQLRREASEGWLPESFEAEARFGHRTARLYPFLGRQVLTRTGRFAPGRRGAVPSGDRRTRGPHRRGTGRSRSSAEGG